MGLIRDTWLELWRRNRGGGILTLAFWYTLITTLYQYVVASRLGPSLPKSLTNMVTHPGAATVLPHLSGALWTKLGLVYLTFLVIILPFTVGGLYGGIAAAVREKPQFTGPLAFFRFGYANFWRALTQVVLALVYGILILAVLTGIFLVFSAIAPSSAGLGIVVVVIAAVAILWLVGTVLYWFGDTFSTDDPPGAGWKSAMRWGMGNLGRLYGATALLIAVLLVALVVSTLLANSIPVIGPVVLVLVLGMVMPAFLAIYAVLLYQRYSGG